MDLVHELKTIFADRLQVPTANQPLWVVSRQGLATMKRIAGRPQDLADLERLGVE